MNENKNPLLWSKSRQRPHPQINDFANRFRVIDESIPIEDEAVSGLDRNWGLGFHQFSSALKLDESNLVIPVSVDNGHLTNIDLKIIIGEIFEPGRFLRNAIEQMFYFGQRNVLWPSEFLDSTKFHADSRYVHPDIFKEFHAMQMDCEDPVAENPPCLWSELERVSVLFKYKQQSGDNIDVFILNGIDDEAAQASYLTNVTGNCGHLPMLWSVFNVRLPKSVSDKHKVFVSEEQDERIYKLTYTLIQSRYLVNLAVYSENVIKVTLNSSKNFTSNKVQTPPFVIVVPTTGDIFVFMKLEGNAISLYGSEGSLRLGAEVGNALRLLSQKQNSQERTNPVIVTGLVSQNIRDEFELTDKYASTALALEIFLHNLIIVADTITTFDVDRLRVLVTEMMENCIKLPDLQKQYRARCWWAITRGELGHETEAMKIFNEKRNLVNIRRSAWDYTLRRKYSEEYSESGTIIKHKVLEMLSVFHKTDVVTFSSNNSVLKKDLFNLIERPFSVNGMTVSPINARIDAMNMTYSDNGGPRLYNQYELDYMMTNVNGKTERMKLTQRLFRGNPVFLHLIYAVSPAAMQKSNLARGHACLCKVYLQNPSNSFDTKQERYLVVEWLEGVFDNLYKLCAVPTLTYLSNFFKVQVKQREYHPTKVLHILGAYGSCAPTSLYAANERMKSLFETKNQWDWDPYDLSLEEGKDYLKELAYSLLLLQLTPKTANRRDHEKMNATPKQKK